jgi:hypothetical protein
MPMWASVDWFLVLQDQGASNARYKSHLSLEICANELKYIYTLYIYITPGCSLSIGYTRPKLRARPHHLQPIDPTY